MLALYLTVGKEFCNFHFLATTGYQFPARTGDKDTELFYLNAHLDYQLFGWIYPLVNQLDEPHDGCPCFCRPGTASSIWATLKPAVTSPPSPPV